MKASRCLQESKNAPMGSGALCHLMRFLEMSFRLCPQAQVSTCKMLNNKTFQQQLTPIKQPTTVLLDRAVKNNLQRCYTFERAARRISKCLK